MPETRFSASNLPSEWDRGLMGVKDEGII